MRTEIVRADGTLQLGEHARLAGYRPGMAVRVLVTRAGSLILSLDDAPPLDVPYAALRGGAVRKALDAGRPRR